MRRIGLITRWNRGKFFDYLRHCSLYNFSWNREGIQNVSKIIWEFRVVHLAASGIFAVLVVLILMLPKIIRAIVSGYVDVKRVNNETKEKTPTSENEDV